ncbi:unnamed protein product [Sphagnum jensenii]
MNPLHMPSFTPRFYPLGPERRDRARTAIVGVGGNSVRAGAGRGPGGRGERPRGGGGGGGVIGRGRAAGPFEPPRVEWRHLGRVAIHLATSRSPPGEVTGRGRKIHRSLRTVAGGPAPALVSPPEERLYEQLRVAEFYNCECLLLV